MAAAAGLRASAQRASASARRVSAFARGVATLVLLAVLLGFGWCASALADDGASSAGVRGSAEPADKRPAASPSPPAAAAVPSPKPAARAARMHFSLPIRCAPGEDCFVQNHVDRDPGSGWRDFACGHLSYDGHQGTDFRLRSLAAMERGVEVLAAAAGRVVGVRDGEPDVSVRERGRENLRGRDAGNGVRIDHGGGWVTQYSHLKEGSVRVRPGQRVREGQVLGLVGLSGNTEFPHLDFIVRKDGRPLDPYSPNRRPPAGAAPGCAQGPAADTLWRYELIDRLRYRATDVLIAGFAPEEADRGKAQRGEYDGAFDPGAPALVFFAESFGARRGDRERLEVIGPDGRRLLQRDRVIDNDLAAHFTYAGRRLRSERWPEGEYLGRYRLMRGDEVVAQAERRITLR